MAFLSVGTRRQSAGTIHGGSRGGKFRKGRYNRIGVPDNDRLVARGGVGPIGHPAIGQGGGERTRIRRGVHSEEPKRALPRRRRDAFRDDARTSRAHFATRFVFGCSAMAVGADGEVVDGVVYAAILPIERAIQTQLDDGTGRGVGAQTIEQVHGGIPALGEAFVDVLAEFSERLGGISRIARVHRSISCSTLSLLELYEIERVFFCWVYFCPKSNILRTHIFPEALHVN